MRRTAAIAFGRLDQVRHRQLREDVAVWQRPAQPAEENHLVLGQNRLFFIAREGFLFGRLLAQENRDPDTEDGEHPNE